MHELKFVNKYVAKKISHHKLSFTAKKQCTNSCIQLYGISLNHQLSKMNISNIAPPLGGSISATHVQKKQDRQLKRFLSFWWSRLPCFLMQYEWKDMI